MHQRRSINRNLRCKRLAAGIIESQAEEVARLVADQAGCDMAINGNYVYKLERGVITWPNRARRETFHTLFNALSDAELGVLYEQDQKRRGNWLAPADGSGTLSGSATINQNYHRTEP